MIGVKRLSVRWRSTLTTRRLLVVLLIVITVGMLVISGWWRKKLDFSDPALLSVQIKDRDGREVGINRTNHFADGFEHGIERRIEGWHQHMKPASDSNAGSQANLVE